MMHVPYTSVFMCNNATGCVEELIDCSGGDEISLESGTARKLDAMCEAIQRVGRACSAHFEAD